MYNYLCLEAAIQKFFFKKDAVQIRSKPTGEQVRRSAISTKLLCTFIEITPTHSCAPDNPKYTRRTPFQMHK